MIEETLNEVFFLKISLPSFKISQTAFKKNYITVKKSDAIDIIQFQKQNPILSFKTHSLHLTKQL